MPTAFRISLNEKLYVRDPEHSDLGRKIVRQGLLLINKLGFEDFTFRKLAKSINTTEASVYRYFENKHRLLMYLLSWYWAFLDQRIQFETRNIRSSKARLRIAVAALIEPSRSLSFSEFIDESEIQDLLMRDGSKAYLTRHVTRDNRDRLFQPYKDLCATIAELISEYDPRYVFPHSLATTVIEMAHFQTFFMINLPSLTDLSANPDRKRLAKFLESLLFSPLKQAQLQKKTLSAPTDLSHKAD
jgi:AcrR family transcriptional regulator